MKQTWHKTDPSAHHTARDNDRAFVGRGDLMPSSSVRLEEAFARHSVMTAQEPTFCRARVKSGGVCNTH